jgi:sugar phosphate isomerase/epimerase
VKKLCDKISFSSLVFKEKYGKELRITDLIGEPIAPFLEKYCIPLDVHFVEVWYPNLIDKATAKEVKEVMESYGCKASSILSTIGFNMVSAPRLWHPWYKWILDVLDTAKTMGPECLVVMAPGNYQAFGWTVEQGLENFKENVKKILPDVEKRGVTVCVETAHGLMDNPENMLNVLKDIDSPYLKVNYCLGASVGVSEFEGFPYAFELLKDYIGYVHIRSSGSYPVPGMSGGQRMMTRLGRGRENVDGFLERLKEIGYKGYIVLELYGFQASEMFEELKFAVDYVRKRFTWD